MNLDEIIRLLVGFLGGGLIGAIVNWMHNAKAAQINRQIEYASLQLHDLYGPLYYFACLNEKLHELTYTIHAAYDVEYCQKQWSSDTATMESINHEATATINIANAYTQMMIDNNAKMVQILTQHYALIDPEDSELLQEFVISSLRTKIEYGSGKLDLPHRIYEQVGNISYYRSAWTTRISEQFHKKSSRLAQLRREWRWKPRLRILA